MALSFQGLYYVMTYCVTDKKIKYGVLPSGLTYYIRHNETPKDLACFYLVKKFGSIVEEDEEQGFAHFLEHMSFEGSLNFPDDQMNRCLETIGVRFGEESNAYTSAEETVYSIKNVPVTEENCSNCLQILQDWISALTLTDKAINVEKGIILEEFRVTSTPFYRMFEKMFPKLFKGSRYADRATVLGKYDIIRDFEPELLRKFYRKWSRPDLSAIVIIGDFDAEEMERQVKKISFDSLSSECNLPAFSDSLRPERVDYTIPDNDRPLVTVQMDTEQKSGRIILFLKKDAYDKEYIKTYECLRDAYLHELVVRMLNSRLMYIANGNSAPFVDPYVSLGDYILSKTKRAIDICVDFDPEKFIEALESSYTELLRAVRFGFSENELNKARTGWLASMESQYKDRDNRKSPDFAEEYVKHFTRHEPLPSIEDEYEFAMNTIPAISLEEVNKVASELYKGQNLVVSCFLPSSLEITEEQVELIIDAIDNKDIEPFVNLDENEPLIESLPNPGSVISITDSVMGYRKFVLSNGATAYLKTTDFTEDEILLYATSVCGKCCYDINDYRELFAMDQIPEIGGLGKHSKQKLYSLIEDKQLDLEAHGNPLLSSIRANSSVTDFKDMMEILHLMFTSPRFDEDAFNIWKQRAVTTLKNYEANYLSETMKMVNDELFCKSQVYNRINSSEVEGIDYRKAFDIYKEVFSNPANFDFIITGNITEEELVPYLEKYVASIIPTSEKKAEKSFHEMNPGIKDNIKYVEMESPSTYSVTAFYADFEVTARNLLLADILAQTVDMDVVNIVRQKDGDAYMAYADGNLSVFSPSSAFLYILYQTNVGNETEVNCKIDSLLQSYVENGPSQENLDKSKEYSKKRFIKDMELNKFLQTKLCNYLYSSVDETADYESILDSITTEELRDFAKKMISSGNRKRCTITAK